MLPGDCVLTTYGVAVVTHLCTDTHDRSLFCARLWRIPGKSIASSSYATLRKDSVSFFCFPFLSLCCFTMHATKVVERVHRGL
jgi:hypothetical protein